MPLLSMKSCSGDSWRSWWRLELDVNVPISSHFVCVLMTRISPTSSLRLVNTLPADTSKTCISPENMIVHANLPLSETLNATVFAYTVAERHDTDVPASSNRCLSNIAKAGDDLGPD